MIYFLTSNPRIDSGGLNLANKFVDNLQKHITNPMTILYICSSPDSFEKNEKYSKILIDDFKISGFEVSEYFVLDHRNVRDAAELVGKADVILLAGGHVPTQNDFFKEIQLHQLLKGYEGIVIGISAGSMNSADMVYVHPELEGEAISKTFERFRVGLGITKLMLLPHYQDIKNDVLDGLRVFEDIAYPDSYGRIFYAIVDGSYVYGHDGIEELLGEAYTIQDGILTQFSKLNDCMRISR
ncbi:MAG: Type 1 glutamine amidotransferase-like domain-containing protein [Erysipelotrichales bacterium]|nr:Type 1 glutamine amidotransferase-like domain-containing protein [Erysipelotrichales bacterium]